MGVKERMRQKNLLKKQNLKNKKFFLNDIPNFNKYFEYSGAWKSKNKKQLINYKQEKREFIDFLNAEMYLNTNRSYYPIKDLLFISKISYKRYELLEKKTLLYGSKSKYN